MNTRCLLKKALFGISLSTMCLFTFNISLALTNPFKKVAVNIKDNKANNNEISSTTTSKLEKPVSTKTYRVSNQQDLINQLKRIKLSGGIILLKPGVDYGDLSTSGKTINGARNIVLMTDPKYKVKAKIKGLRIHNSYNVKIMNIEFTGLSTKPAVEVSATNGLNISNCEISGGHDGILVKGKYIFDKNWKVTGIDKVQNINIKNNNIHDIQRDGIHVIHANGVFIQNNTLSSFHPNYEGMKQEAFNGSKHDSEKIRINGATVNRDHSDSIQVTDSSRIAVTNNTINASGGAWNQSIFIKMEQNKKNDDWIKVADNNIKNDHPHGIRIHGYNKISQNDVNLNNKLQRIETIGSSAIPNTPLVSVD